MNNKLHQKQEFDYLFRISIVGEVLAGKTSIFKRYSENEFNDNRYSVTNGYDFRIKYENLINGKKVKVQIWDCNGGIRLREIAKNNFFSSNGIILVYDLNDQESFDFIVNWFIEYKDKLKELSINESYDYPPIIALGNKLDLYGKPPEPYPPNSTISNGYLHVRTSENSGYTTKIRNLIPVDQLKAKQYFDSLSIPSYFVSAKDSTNINESIQTLVQLIYDIAPPPPYAHKNSNNDDNSLFNKYCAIQ